MFLREKLLISDHSLFSSYDGYLNMERGTGKIHEAFFRNAQSFRWLNAGSRAGLINSSRSLPPLISGI